SHPADYTPVCTTEFVAFQKRFSEFKALNCELIGLSIDQVFSHIKWTEWIKENLDVEIEFPIIADDMGRVAAKLGMVHPGKGTNTVRAVFIVDDKGKLRIMFYYPQELGRNMDEILRAVKGMQTSDANGVAIPAGWPSNELVGDSVIVPPANNVKTAKERTGATDWLTHEGLPLFLCLPIRRHPAAATGGADEVVTLPEDACGT
ncbi:Peroxiredoxin, partial [Aduncisulcus paluster]